MKPKVWSEAVIHPEALARRFEVLAYIRFSRTAGIARFRCDQQAVALLAVSGSRPSAQVRR